MRSTSLFSTDAMQHVYERTYNDVLAAVIFCFFRLNFESTEINKSCFVVASSSLQCRTRYAFYYCAAGNNYIQPQCDAADLFSSLVFLQGLSLYENIRVYINILQSRSAETRNNKDIYSSTFRKPIL